MRVHCIRVAWLQTPLHYAAAATHGAICLELLVSQGADINVKVGADITKIIRYKT